MIKLSNTNQRRVIIEELRKLDSHPTADELYEIVRRKLPRISLGTVYRNLEALAEFGEIWKLEFAGKQKRFDGNTEKHSHLRCTVCGNVEDIDIPGSERLDAELNKLLGGRIRTGRIEFYGYCKECASAMGLESSGDEQHSGARASRQF